MRLKKGLLERETHINQQNVHMWYHVGESWYSINPSWNVLNLWNVGHFWWSLCSFLIYHHHLTETRVCSSIYYATIMLSMQWSIIWNYSREKILASQWQGWTLEKRFIDRTSMCQILCQVLGLQRWISTVSMFEKCTGQVKNCKYMACDQLLLQVASRADITLFSFQA